MAEKTRHVKVAAEVKKILSQYLLRGEISISGGLNTALVSITDVKVSPCLQHVKAFVVSLSDKFSNEDCVSFLQENVSKIRYYVGSHMRLKFTPDIRFFVDDSFAYADKIENLLNNITYSKDEF